MLIRNYGLYWSPKKVFWGYPGVEGTLFGVPRRSRTTSATDFRDQIAVYVLCQEFRPIYVGQTGTGNARLFRRLRAHRKDHLRGRWDSFCWFGVIPVTGRSRRLKRSYRIKPDLNDVLNHIEAILIAVLEPKLNLQRGRFGSAEHYLQADDARLDEPLETQVQQLLEKVTSLEEK